MALAWLVCLVRLIVRHERRVDAGWISMARSFAFGTRT
jgi:hypothetical protein